MANRGSLIYRTDRGNRRPLFSTVRVVEEPGELDFEWDRVAPRSSRSRLESWPRPNEKDLIGAESL